jgi:hypothetical protein
MFLLGARVVRLGVTSKVFAIHAACIVNSVEGLCSDRQGVVEPTTAGRSAPSDSDRRGSISVSERSPAFVTLNSAPSVEGLPEIKPLGITAGECNTLAGFCILRKPDAAQQG